MFLKELSAACVNYVRIHPLILFRANVYMYTIHPHHFLSISVSCGSPFKAGFFRYTPPAARTALSGSDETEKKTICRLQKRIPKIGPRGYSEEWLCKPVEIWTYFVDISATATVFIKTIPWRWTLSQENGKL